MTESFVPNISIKDAKREGARSVAPMGRCIGPVSASLDDLTVGENLTRGLKTTQRNGIA